MPETAVVNEAVNVVEKVASTGHTEAAIVLSATLLIGLGVGFFAGYKAQPKIVEAKAKKDALKANCEVVEETTEK